MKQISEQKSELVENKLSESPSIQDTPVWYAFWKFSRPHTIIGTTLSVLGLYLIALARYEYGFSISQLILVLGAWIACIGGNIYIVGLNQLEDIAIDQINKPHLPLAAGEFSRKQAQIIIAISGAIALLFSASQGPFLLATVGISLAIGTAYSLPPIRLKRFPFFAALCIFTVRGAIVNLGLFLHFQWVLEVAKSANFSFFIPDYLLFVPGEVWALTLFVLVFTVAIAIFKDIPDMEGDRQYDITTFTIQLGKESVFNLSRWVLTVCYVGMTIAAVLWLRDVNGILIAITHLSALGLMWFWSRKVDLQEKAEIAKFYQFIWKLFFLEYLVFPLACLLS
ncbi:homogentisate phytyltransferase [Oscillatoriales cyanobacterium USR001]|nr:homogentisate phytyltransferase [Oscillatoriales cyanobacterium USR001]